MKTENITKSIISVGGTTLGAVTSRVVADSAPINNPKVKHGVIAGIAILGAAFLNRETPSGAFAQDVAIGVSATQLGYLVKELVGESKGVVKTALGNPNDGMDFLASYTDYDFIPTAPITVESDYQEVSSQIAFR